MSNEAETPSDTDASNLDESENNTSFVKKVKSHVSGLLPSSLSKWFGSPAAAAASSSATVRQREDDDDDDDDNELYKLEPPAKRVKLPPTFNHFEKGYLPSTSRHRNHLSLNSTPLSHDPIGRTTRDLGNCDSDSGESTSGYSSMPWIGSKEQVSDFTEQVAGPSKEPPIKRNSRIFNTTTNTTERTLFSDSILEATAASSTRVHNESLSSRRPSFNASAFGSSNFLDRTITTRRIVNSPFYSGRTTYGGAAAYSRNLLQPPNNSKVKTQAATKTATSGSSGGDTTNKNNATLSKTAKRILDTLEQYTSPIQDARRIPNPANASRSSYMMNKYTGANPYGVVRESPRGSSNSRQELQVPTMTRLLKMKLKERLQDSTTSVRQLAADSQSSLNQKEYTLKLDETSQESGLKRQSKMKTKVVNLRQKSSSRANAEEEPVRLPDVQLPITTLPTFNFIVPALKSESEKATPNGIITNSTISSSSSGGEEQSERSAPKTTKENAEAIVVVKDSVAATKEDSTMCPTPKKVAKVTPSIEYKFASPVVIKENNNAMNTTLKGVNEFVFSKPLIRKQNGIMNVVNVTTTTTPQPPCLQNFNFNGDNVKLLKKRTLATSGDSTDFAAAASCSPAKSALREGSVLDVLAKMKKEDASSSSPTMVTSKDSWECSNCWVRNLADKKKCAACEAAKPDSSSSSSTTPSLLKEMPKGQKASSASSSTSFGDQFKMKPAQWECPSCLVRNGDSRTDCVACTTKKPPSPTTQTQSYSSMTAVSSKVAGFGDAFKLMANQWDCPVCMVRNNKDTDVCTACTTPRSGAAKSTSQVPKSGGQEMMKKTTTAASWECPTCMIRNTQEKLKCACCETDKPGSNVVTASNSGKKDADWECPSCMVRNSSTKSSCVCCETPKPGSSSTSANQSSGSAAAKPETPKFAFGINNGLINGHGFTFGIPATTTSTKTDAPAVSFSNATTFIKDNSESSSATPTTAKFSFGIPATTTETKQPNSDSTNKTFAFGIGNTTFGSGNVKASPNTTNTAGFFNTSLPKSTATEIQVQKSKTEAVKLVTQNVDAASIVQPVNTPANKKQEQFSFGLNTVKSPQEKTPFASSSSTTTTTEKATDKQQISLFSFSNTNSVKEGSKADTSVSQNNNAAVFSFKENQSFKEKTEVNKAPMFSFGSNNSDKKFPSTNLTENNNLTTNITADNNSMKNNFNFSTSSTPASAFNTTASAFNTTAAAFNTAAAAAATTTASNVSIFGAPNKSVFAADKPPLAANFNAFQSNTAGVFGGNAVNNTFGSSVFGGNTPVPSAGNTQAPSASINNAFGGSNAEQNAKPFSFGSSATTTAGTAMFNAAGPDNGNGGNAKAEWKPSNNGVFTFGSKSNPPSISAPNANASTGFNFGKTTFDAKPGGFNFGGSGVPQVPAPTFNFTGGAPATFTANAQNADSKPTNRVIRKALRRTQR